MSTPLRAAPKLATERARQILQYAIEQRDKGALFVSVMSSELEALAQELIDSRAARQLDGQLERDARMLTRARAGLATPGELARLARLKIQVKK